jgi:hypothetical protein
MVTPGRDVSITPSPLSPHAHNLYYISEESEEQHHMGGLTGGGVTGVRITPSPLQPHTNVYELFF